MRFLSSEPIVGFLEQSIPLVPHDLPDDPRFEDLWGLKNSGQSRSGVGWDRVGLHAAGEIGSDISIEEAWAGGFGTEEIIVGVTDTGVDLSHPDLENNKWINSDEIPGNGVDDDQNGYIDDVHGWDFCKNDNLPEDRHSHGTHVAGTIAAAIGNNTGIVGVAPRAKIMALRMLPGCNRDASCDVQEDCPELFKEGTYDGCVALRRTMVQELLMRACL